MKRVVIIGGGVIGMCSAYYAAQRGHQVTVIDQREEQHEGCSYGNAGMVVPSHFVPLAAPGMVALGLKWMWNPESPFYVRPRLDRELVSWGTKFYRAANAAHVRRSAPVLRDLQLASRRCFEELASERGNDFGLVQRGLLMLCHSDHGFQEEKATAAWARELGIPAEERSPADLDRLEPNVRMDVVGAVHFPQD